MNLTYKTCDDCGKSYIDIVTKVQREVTKHLFLMGHKRRSVCPDCTNTWTEEEVKAVLARKENGGEVAPAFQNNN